MLTNPAIADPQDPAEITAATVAREAAEQRQLTALQEIAQLAASGAISTLEATELRAETLARFVQEARDLEARGEELCGAVLWARYERRARQRTEASVADRLRSPRLRGLSSRVRTLRERQMAVVASARVDATLRRLLLGDEDPDTLSVRHDLAAAGLL